MLRAIKIPNTLGLQLTSVRLSSGAINATFGDRFIPSGGQSENNLFDDGP